MKLIGFYKKNNKWYADLPGHTEEENEMVFGADVLCESWLKWLRELEKDMGDDPRPDDRITLAVSAANDPVPEHPDYCMHLTMNSHDEDGAEYIVTVGNKFVEWVDDGTQGFEVPTTVWICNVTHDFFGEHPNHIYIY